MDEFAQTRGADDLFDDDFTPLEAPPSQQHHHPDSGPLSASPPHQPSPPSPSHPPPPDNAPNKPHAIPPPQPRQSPSTSTTTTTTAPEPPPASPSPSTHPAAAAATPTTSPPPPNPPPPQSVRGPRHLSGGPGRIRLTEAELSAKLAAARLNSSRRAEAHARAEADEASFLQREARAGERRREEGRNRRVMESERERNRLRKLEVGRRGGREWDEGKVEEGMGGREERGGGRGVGRRGRGGQLFGDGGGVEGGVDGVGGDGGRGFDGRGGRGRGRGRGVRGGGGGGGGGRGRGGFQPGQRAEQRVPDPQMDFPALPSATKVNGQQAVAPDTVRESLLEAKTEQPSWDDQMAEAGGNL